MSSTPVKWKIFIVANYILLIVFSIILGSLTWSYINSGVHNEDLAYAIPVTSGVLIFILNSLFNVIIYHKFFPNKIYPLRTRVLHIIQTIFYILTLLGLIVLEIWGLNDEITQQREDNTGIILLIFLGFVIILGIYVLVCQLTLRKYLKSNFNKNIETIIETIGDDSNLQLNS